MFDDCFPRKTSYYITHPWAYFVDLHYKHKWMRQRARRGFADCDVWNMDNYLLHLIPQMLRALADTAHGYSDSDFSSLEEWKTWLRELAAKFEINTGDFDDYNIQYVKECYEEMLEQYPALWD